MPGQLFTQYFLTDGIQATAEWRRSLAAPQAFATFHKEASQRLEALAQAANPNKALTEQEVVLPLLKTLGCVDYLP